MELTPELLAISYNKYKAPKWVKFAFKYFSRSTEKKNLNLNNIFTYMLLGLFCTGMLGTILHWSRVIIGSVTSIYSIILGILVLFLLAAALVNNRRIKKIVKDLGCTIDQYNLAIDKWGDELKLEE